MSETSAGFSPTWLAMREPYDQRARNPAVLDALREAFSGQASVAVVDLGCGTGATMRALAPVLPKRQSWRLVDNDLSLLARVEAPGAAPDIASTPTPLDLSHDLELALDGHVDLVTISALLDLVSPEWLDRLAVEAAARRLPVYASLTYDGQIMFDPADDLDAKVVNAFNRHQLADKGFGPALGPRAARMTIEALEKVGYKVKSGQSDWQFGPDDEEIQLELIAGFAAAARETGLVELEDLVAWTARRREMITNGMAGMLIGHLDVFARLA